MPGVLLDTHALYWLVSGTRQLSNEALLAIGENQETGTLYVSPISAWELSIASRKPVDAPQLDNTISRWFKAAVRAVSARCLNINQRIALEAAEVPLKTGHKDPGDCYLIATARVRKMPIVSRDRTMQKLSNAHEGCFDIIEC